MLTNPIPLKSSHESTTAKPARSYLAGMAEGVFIALILVLSLWVLAFYFEHSLRPAYMAVSVVVFLLAVWSTMQFKSSVMENVLNILIFWCCAAILFRLGDFSAHYTRYFSKEVVVNWLWIAPLSQIGAHIVLRGIFPGLFKVPLPSRRMVIVGMNRQGIALAKKVEFAPYADTAFLGFFEDRGMDRISKEDRYRVLGKIENLAAYVKKHRVQSVYLSLPMTAQPRILEILDDLKDTTCSIYFVPDMFITDLIQGRSQSVCGVDVISVCDTPFRGFRGFLKRASDIILSIFILLLICPLLLLIAVMVKSTSPGPVIFRQRRYGLDGEQIVVYKFRSMAVTEDGNTIQQATKNDLRITRLGAFLRKTSLDELPQFINVLQGRMSIVGPRPHAVAHNEMYRTLIKGYMVRHKVRPGITGWAQVNGLRGETDKLEKMQARVDFDLDYLRKWSLMLDMLIILKTIRLVFKDSTAY
ncbi:undecaprenyl-phosphate glucose phosphotransferase [Polaromonas glacialis]|uniref:undecaprenyl-phosphate glucose phosphotransferase n=1 Tax=Polaromonas glacialis TaxID=866564 RepID=UPI000ACAB0B1|nr:undecaprenyl-phosphate glucose phosphotransferase [Polaromonas glacialis]